MTDASELWKFHEAVKSDIRHYGRSVICVCGESNDYLYDFAYTIGDGPGFPELLIIGTVDGRVLNALSNTMIERGRPFADDELVDVGGKFPLKIINADYRARDEYSIQASQHFGHENYRVLQVLTPDLDGRFPDDPKCRPPFSDNSVLRAQ